MNPPSSNKILIHQSIVPRPTHSFFHTLSFASSSRLFKIDLPRPGLLASTLNRPSSCPDWLLSTLPWINPFVLMSKRTTWPRDYVAVAAAPRYTILVPSIFVRSREAYQCDGLASLTHHQWWRWCWRHIDPKACGGARALSWWKFCILVIFKNLFYK